MSKKPKNGKCVYCLKEVDSITKDHIPPKCITPQEFKEDFLTVPACFECNQKLSLEDEYFRITMLISESVSEQEHLKETSFKTLNRFKHPVPFWDKFLSKIQRIDFYNEDEQYLGRKLQYTVDYHRIADYFIRLARGLFYLDTQNYIPLDYIVTSIDIFDQFNEKDAHFIRMFYDAIKNLSFTNRTGIMKYRYRLYQTEHKIHSIWNIIVYDKINFLIYFTKKEVNSNFKTNAYNYIVEGV